MKHFLLFYDYAPDFMALRAPNRAAHLAYANASVARDELQLADALVGHEIEARISDYRSKKPHVVAKALREKAAAE